MFCLCGCGKKTKIAYESSTRNGWIKGQPLKYLHGHNMKGTKRIFSDKALLNMSRGQKRRFKKPEDHPAWKGGLLFHKGYMWIHRKGDPKANRHGYMKRFHAVLEDFYGRGIIMPGYVVHHVNHNKTDDRLINLALMTNSDHSKLHWRERKCSSNQNNIAE